ncbi:MAG: hypothetical protein LBI05_11020 [Planctomycetaceae bacterium]|jgi:hypothetical protein|nr:hypothetical protein [Planctomycetaceae bacterium]
MTKESHENSIDIIRDFPPLPHGVQHIGGIVAVLKARVEQRSAENEPPTTPNPTGEQFYEQTEPSSF